MIDPRNMHAKYESCLCLTLHVELMIAGGGTDRQANKQTDRKEYATDYSIINQNGMKA